MVPIRIAFDSSLPVIVSVSEIDVGGVKLVAGDPLKWRELGLSELLLFEYWRAGIVVFVEPAHEPAPGNAGDGNEGSGEGSGGDDDGDPSTGDDDDAGAADLAPSNTVEIDVTDAAGVTATVDLDAHEDLLDSPAHPSAGASDVGDAASVASTDVASDSVVRIDAVDSLPEPRTDAPATSAAAPAGEGSGGDDDGDPSTGDDDDAGAADLAPSNTVEIDVTDAAGVTATVDLDAHEDLLDSPAHPSAGASDVGDAASVASTDVASDSVVRIDAVDSLPEPRTDAPATSAAAPALEDLSDDELEALTAPAPSAAQD